MTDQEKTNDNANSKASESSHASFIRQMAQSIRESIENRPPLSAAEHRLSRREAILSANSYLKYADDGIETNETVSYKPGCPDCGADDMHRDEVNQKRPWLGIGLDEHCRLCGAEPEHQDLLQWPRERWSIPMLLRELVDVEEVYRSHKFMSRVQISENRKYFIQLLNAMQSSDIDHKKDRYEISLESRHAREIRERVIEMAIRLNGGDHELVLAEYRDMSWDLDDLYFVFDDLNAKFLAQEPLQDKQNG